MSRSVGRGTEVTNEAELTDTSDMYRVHNALRRALGDAPAQIKASSEGDKERAKRLASYLGEVLWLLHAHHAGEDELLYPLLVQRAPEHKELFARMESQHAAVSATAESASNAVEEYGLSGSLVAAQEAAGAITALLVTADEHLIEEEEQVLPIAARSVTPAEWAVLPGHAMSHYKGQRIWLPFGLVLEAMPDDVQRKLLGQLPPPVLGMWTGGGSDAFEKEMAYIRGGS
jgi:hemerythrin-like domain-containing protein